MKREYAITIHCNGVAYRNWVFALTPEQATKECMEMIQTAGPVRVIHSMMLTGRYMTNEGRVLGKMES